MRPLVPIFSKLIGICFFPGADSCSWSRHSDDFYLSCCYSHFNRHYPPNSHGNISPQGEYYFLSNSVTSLVCARKVILLYTREIQVAAKVIGEVQALIIFPAIPFAMLAIFYMFWISAALHLFSSGQVVQNNCNNTNCCAYDLVLKKVNCDRCCGYSIRYTPHITIAIFFHLFGCYWATQFFIASSATVIAGSVASYYWAQGEASVS